MNMNFFEMKKIRQSSFLELFATTTQRHKAASTLVSSYLYGKISLGFLFMCFLFSCGKFDGKKNIKEFYYPVDKMDQGIVYEYQSIGNDSLPNEYWFLRNLKTDTATYIAGQYYDHNFTIRQFFSAEIVSNGVLMNDYSIYEFDSLGYQIKRPAQILNGNSFPFEVKDSTGVFLFKLRWDDAKIKDAYVELTRNRRYKGTAEYSFQNKKKECVEFIVKELVDDYNNGHLEQQYNGKELYAKDLGLIYYRKNLGEGFVLEYELVDTFSMHELEKRYNDNGER